MSDSQAYQRLERFYKTLLGDRAEQLRLLRDRDGFKVARAIPGRIDQQQLLTMMRELRLLASTTSDRSTEIIEPSPLNDDAVLIDTTLASRLADNVRFNAGHIYIQALPSYLVINHAPLDGIDVVLDLCSAPGGKAIHCFDRLQRKFPVIANEFSQARRARLISVLRTYGCDRLPLLSIDAGAICRLVTNALPMILLDAPCSGEAHLVRNPKRLAEWRPRQSKVLAMRQHAMAVGALHALKPGGVLLYSTCTVSPYENELMINDLLEKFGPAIEPIPWPTGALDRFITSADQVMPLDHVEDTIIDPRIVRCAWRFWPEPFGEPFFAVLLKKVAPTETKREPEPFPLVYDTTKRRGEKSPERTVLLGPNKRAFSVPANWPELPPLPYQRL